MSRAKSQRRFEHWLWGHVLDQGFVATIEAFRAFNRLRLNPLSLSVAANFKSHRSNQVQVFVLFDSQVRRLAGCSKLSLEVAQDATLHEVVKQVGNFGTAALRSTLMDEHDSLRPSLLVFLNNELVIKDQPCLLHEGAELTLTTLIAGG